VCLVTCALVLVASLPLAGASESSSEVRAGVSRLLRTRAAAVLSGDKRAFMSTVADGTGDFAQRQARLFRSLSNIPLASYRLAAVWSRYGDLVRASDRSAYPGQQVAIPVTEERYGIRGFDGTPIEEDLYYTFVLQGGSWKIAADSALDDLGLGSARQLWDFGPVSVATSKHFMLISHPCSAPIGCAHLPSKMLGLAEQALGRVDSFWQPPWPHKIVILAPTTTAELHRLLQATFDVTKFVAFAYSSEDSQHGLRFIGRRILLNWHAIAHRGSDSVVTILAHELTHVATRSSAGPQIPTFVDEGIAEYVGYNADPSSLAYLDSVVSSGRFDGKLPKDYQFTSGSGAQIYLSYQKAESAVMFFVDRWGWARFVRFYRILGSQRIVTGTPQFHLDKALRRTTGVGLSRFQKQWASSLSQ
jgi:hypothetical protein